MFTTAEFSYRTCANDVDRKGRRYDADFDGKLYSVLFLSSVPSGQTPVIYQVNDKASTRLRTHVDVINHFRLWPNLAEFGVR